MGLIDANSTSATAQRHLASLKEFLSDPALKSAVAANQKTLKGVASGSRVEFHLVEIHVTGVKPDKMLLIGQHRGLLVAAPDALVQVTAGTIEVLRSAIVGKGEIKVDAKGQLSAPAKQYLVKAIGELSKKKVFIS